MHTFTLRIIYVGNKLWKICVRLNLSLVIYFCNLVKTKPISAKGIIVRYVADSLSSLQLRLSMNFNNHNFIYFMAFPKLRLPRGYILNIFTGTQE